MNIDLLLERIGYGGRLECNLSTLCDLHYSFMSSVPFENLDIHLGREVKLDFDHIWQKVVVERRGGWCYELNELFLYLLTELGFSTKRCAGRVILHGDGDPLDHQVSVVDQAGPWLVDVGFGDFAVGPLRIDTPDVQEVEAVRYRVQPELTMSGASLAQPPGFRVSKEVGGAFTGCYVFSIVKRSRAEFQDRCTWLQTSADSSFTQKRVCSMHTGAGRLTLSGNQLLLNGVKVAQVSEQEYGDCLNEKFGIVLTNPLWIRPGNRSVDEVLPAKEE